MLIYISKIMFLLLENKLMIDQYNSLKVGTYSMDMMDIDHALWRTQKVPIQQLVLWSVTVKTTDHKTNLLYATKLDHDRREILCSDSN